jgi:hypothetical protein
VGDVLDDGGVPDHTLADEEADGEIEVVVVVDAAAQHDRDGPKRGAVGGELDLERSLIGDQIGGIGRTGQGTPPGTGHGLFAGDHGIIIASIRMDA